MKYDVTLLSVNWNQLNAMKLMLKSYVHTHYNDEKLKVLIVDNGSTDGSKEWLRENGVPFLDLPTNIGHEQAINVVYPSITTKYLLLVDTDVMFLTNVYEKYLHRIAGDEKYRIAGEYITKDQLNDPVKPRVGAWFMLLDIEEMKRCGVKKFRDSEDWSYDVGSWMTEKVLQCGYQIYHIPRLNKDIDNDLVGMVYDGFSHFGKVSWDLEKHQDRETEVTKRRESIYSILKQYARLSIENIFV